MRFYFIIIFLYFSFQQNCWSENILTEFLIAKPSMQDHRFKETVIVMLYHNQKKGAAGLVINKPIDTMLISEFFKNSNMSLPDKIIDKEITIYWGGPVNSDKVFIIYSSEYKNDDFIISNNYFTIAQTPKVLIDIVTNKGPKKYFIILGISAWKPGQLDLEIKRDDWVKKLNNYSSLFNNGDEMWNRLINSQDI